MEIYIDSKQTRIDIEPQEIRTKTEKILEDLGCSPDSVLSIAFVEAAEMGELNLKYLGREGPTNVLSFSQLEGDGPSFHSNLLGDVVICTDVAAQEAADLGYDPHQMLTYLLIHGILHLLGHTHEQAEDSAAMSSQAEQLFHQFYPEDL
jgi:probable rRNA maturation factor